MLVGRSAARMAYRIQTKTPRFQLAHLGSMERSAKAFVNVVLQRRTLIPFAIRTALVAFDFHKRLQCLLILGAAVRSGICWATCVRHFLKFFGRRVPERPVVKRKW